MTRSFALSGDLAHPYVVAACVLAALSVALLLIELWRHPGHRKASVANLHTSEPAQNVNAGSAGEFP